METFNESIIANFIFTLSKYDTLCKADLVFAFTVFLQQEEYEKCGVLKKLIDSNQYNNEKQSNSAGILSILKKIDTCNDKDEDVRQFSKILSNLEKELMDFIAKIEDVYCEKHPSISRTKEF